MGPERLGGEVSQDTFGNADALTAGKIHQDYRGLHGLLFSRLPSAAPGSEYALTP